MIVKCLIYIPDFPIKLKILVTFKLYANYALLSQKCIYKSPSMESFSQIKANLEWMVLKWSPFKNAF
jgi:hypothetical protein